MRLFQKQGHKIIHGDTSLVLKTEIEPETIDLIFIDPPYNIGKKFSNHMRERHQYMTALRIDSLSLRHLSKC